MARLAKQTAFRGWTTGSSAKIRALRWVVSVSVDHLHPGTATRSLSAFTPTLIPGNVTVGPGVASRTASAYSPTLSTAVLTAQPACAVRARIAHSPNLAQGGLVFVGVGDVVELRTGTEIPIPAGVKKKDLLVIIVAHKSAMAQYRFRWANQSFTKPDWYEAASKSIAALNYETANLMIHYIHAPVDDPPKLIQGQLTAQHCCVVAFRNSKFTLADHVPQVGEQNPPLYDIVSPVDVSATLGRSTGYPSYSKSMDSPPLTTSQAAELVIIAHAAAIQASATFSVGDAGALASFAVLKQKSYIKSPPGIAMAVSSGVKNSPGNIGAPKISSSASISKYAAAAVALLSEPIPLRVDPATATLSTTAYSPALIPAPVSVDVGCASRTRNAYSPQLDINMDTSQVAKLSRAAWRTRSAFTPSIAQYVYPATAKRHTFAYKPAARRELGMTMKMRRDRNRVANRERRITKRSTVKVMDRQV